MCVFQAGTFFPLYVCVCLCVLCVLALELWECVYQQQQHSPSCPQGPKHSGSHERAAHAACHWIVLVSIMKLDTKLLQINQ